MNKMMRIGMVACSVLASTMAFAEDEDIYSDVSQQSGFFLGLGGSYHSIKFRLDYSAAGEADVFDSTGAFIATGSAGGPGAPFSETITTFAPEVQVGYNGYFGCSCTFWGLKYLYQYIDATSIDKLVDTPQAGFLDPVNNSPISFTGNVITKSVQTTLNHKMALLAFLGLQLEDFKIYLGLGPSLFGTESDVYQAFGFANPEGIPREATGVPLSFSSSKWVWGGAGQIGLSYIFCPCWFLDFNYTYAISQNYRKNDSAPFTTSVIGGYTDIGTLFIKAKRQIRDQSLSFTINWSY